MNAPSTFRSSLRRPWLQALAGAALVVAAVAAYARCVNVPFLFDDAPAIERNTSIRHLWPPTQALSPPESAAGAAGRPLVNLTLAINYAIGGLDPRGYHIFNLALHALVGLTLFGLVRRTLLQPPLRERYGETALPFAFGVVALWVVHPLLTESVVCVVQRNELLVSLFYLLTLYCTVRSFDSGFSGRWQFLAVGCCLLGMASKEVMATAPLMVLLYDRTFAAGSFREAWRQRGRLYIALALTWVLLAVLVRQHHQRAGIVGFGLGVGPWEYLLTQCRALTTYLRLSVWPHPLVLDYGVEMTHSLREIWLQGLIVVALLTATVTALWRRPVLGFVGAWFFVILAPSSSILPLTTQPIAEHRMYLPLAAGAVLAVAGIYALPGKLSAVIVAALSFTLGWVTVVRVGDYQDAVTIWTDTIAEHPENARAHASLGNVLIRRGQWSAAAPHYERAVRLRPDYADAQSDYASVLLKLGQVDAALAHFEAAQKLKPDDLDIRYNFAVALAQAGRLPEAIMNLEAVLRRQPGHASAWNNLGDALLKSGRHQEAVTAFEQALRAQPNFAAAHNNAGVALAALNRWPEAIQHYAAAMRLDPANAEIRGNLANTLLQAGRPADAGAEYQEALRLKPEWPGLHYNLANVWLQMNRLDEAVREYGEALRLQPNFAAAHHNLGLALTRLDRPAEAVPHYLETLRQLPDSAAAHQNLAVALGLLGRTAEAVSHDEEALRLQPDFPAARRHLELLRAKQQPQK